MTTIMNILLIISLLCGISCLAMAQSAMPRPQAVTGVGQATPPHTLPVTPLPDLDFDRRGDTAYMDSLLAIGRRQLYEAEKRPRSSRNDTVRLESLRYLTIIFKQLRQPFRDSSYVYARRLYTQATALHNTLYAVRGLMQEEYYVRVVQGDYPKALDINRRASELCATLPPARSPRWQVLLNMGNIYFMLREYPEALANFKATLLLLPQYTLLAKRNQQLLLSEAITRIGEIYEAQGRFGEARQQYEASLKIAQETHSRVNIAYASEQLGDFWANRHQTQPSVDYYEQALLVWTQLGDELGQATVWARLAEGYARTNHLKQAIELGEKALQIADKRGSSRVRQMATLSLYRAYRLADQPERALLMFETYHALTDSLNTFRQVDEIQAMQKKSDIARVQAEAEKQQLLQQQQLTEMRRSAELDRLEADADRRQVIANGRAVQLQQRIETGRIQAVAEQNRLAQKAHISELDHAIRQQYATRILLVTGLVVLLLFSGLMARTNRLINRQKREIETLNLGLETKVRERTTELETANDQLRARNRDIADALLRGQTQERKRVAADLHDNLGGLLAAIKVSLLSLDPERMPDREQQVYRNLLTMTKEAYAEIRYLSHNLQPDELEKQGLAKALMHLIDKLNLTQRICFSLQDAQLPSLDRHTEFHLYSICLELCTNILKHSQATNALIDFRQEGAELLMTVRDDGQGLIDRETNGIGLRNIQARAEAMQGLVEIQTSTGKGTTFFFRLPVSQPAKAENSVAGA